MWQLIPIVSAMERIVNDIIDILFLANHPIEQDVRLCGDFTLLIYAIYQAQVAGNKGFNVYIKKVAILVCFLRLGYCFEMKL